MLARIAFAAARLWTWEVVTGFDGVLDPLTLRRRFVEDFPKVAEACRNGDVAAWPVFREMVSFNSTEGRRHRYLVMRVEEDVARYRRHYDRVLPRMAMLFGFADKLMRSADGYENCRLAFLGGGWLYVLVFFEGRLCHWSEESGRDAASAQERLERFDEFLRRDALFSRAESWKFSLVELDGVSDSEKNEWWRRACKDPFWRSVDLDAIAGIKPRAKRKIALLALAGLALAFAFAFGGGEAFFDKGIAYTRPAPDLSPVPEYALGGTYETELVEKKYEEAPHANVARTNVEPAEQETPASCRAPAVKLFGVVEGHLVQASIDGGERMWLRIGDSIGGYVLESIGKDYGVLACGENRMEVRNGP